jgi:hypothetical protein
MNAGLALLVFATLYLVSRGWNLWGDRRGNRKPEITATNEQAAACDSRVKPANFGAHFAGDRQSLR